MRKKWWMRKKYGAKHVAIVEWGFGRSRPRPAGGLGNCAVGPLAPRPSPTLPPIAHSTFPPPPGSRGSRLNSSPGVLQGPERVLHTYLGRKVVLMLLWSPVVTLEKILLDISQGTWIRTYTVSVGTVVPPRPSWSLPQLTLTVHSFRSYLMATHRCLPQRVPESPCMPSCEAEDFQRSGNTQKTAA